TDWPDNPFWDFSLGLYGREGIPDLCIDLQDRLGADVNILLYCCWAAVSGAPMLTESEVAALDAVVRDWREDVVKPLRATRWAMKEMTSPDDTGQQERIRNQVKRSELDAERVQQLMLAAAMPLPATESGESNVSGDVRKAALANMATYLTSLGTPPTDADSAKLSQIADRI
ncbi:MAG: TIGR02444 family protein, partial [Rhodospirillaceae bacterium]